MQETPIPMTEEGYNTYKAKLQRLKTEERAKIALRIRQAKEFGDISDNAEYESAKSDQAFVEGEIIQLERLLQRAQIIDRNELTNDQVHLGSTVELRDENSKDTYKVTVVGTTEADIEKRRISNESPIGAAIMAKKLGETVNVKTPRGPAKYKILHIETNI
ncbi:MAG: transcription elongation factor GreA [Vulcanimicrobiota bacterium]